MTNSEVSQIIGDVPYMSFDQANRLTALIEEYQLRNVLELGFMHGVSTCYLAAALERTGGERVVTIDLEIAKSLEPNIETLLSRTGQRGRVDVYYEKKSYNWRLMKFLEQDSPQFDLCYLDGGHNWYDDGLAFFLVDRLLKPGGWIVLDDLSWTYATSPALSKLEFVERMSQDEKTTPQVGKVYDLLIKRHPQYHNFRVIGDWGFAQKMKTPSMTGDREFVVERIIEVQQQHLGIGWLARQCWRKMMGNANRR